MGWADGNRRRGCWTGEPWGNPEEFTIRQLAEIVVDITGSASKIVHRPLPTDDPKQRQPDISEAQELLGWRPTVPLATAMGGSRANSSSKYPAGFVNPTRMFSP
jgi:nucleoside-diphosphate-sugar epimerase